MLRSSTVSTFGDAGQLPGGSPTSPSTLATVQQYGTSAQVGMPTGRGVGIYGPPMESTGAARPTLALRSAEMPADVGPFMHGTFRSTISSIDTNTAQFTTNTPINVTLEIQVPAAYEGIPGLYQPGTFVFVRSQARVEVIKMRGFATPSTVPIGSEALTLPMLNAELVSRAIESHRNGRKFDATDICRDYAPMGVVKTIEGDSGAPFGRYTQGSQAINAAVTAGGPAYLLDTWGAAGLNSRIGTNLYLVLRAFPTAALDGGALTYCPDPSGGNAVRFTMGDIAGITDLYQVVPYMNAQDGGAPDDAATMYRTSDGAWHRSVVWRVGILQFCDALSRRRPTAVAAQSSIRWPREQVRHMNRMHQLNSLEMLMDTRPALLLADTTGWNPASGRP